MGRTEVETASLTGLPVAAAAVSTKEESRDATRIRRIEYLLCVDSNHHHSGILIGRMSIKTFSGKYFNYLNGAQALICESREKSVSRMSSTLRHECATQIDHPAGTQSTVVSQRRNSKWELSNIVRGLSSMSFRL